MKILAKISNVEEFDVNISFPKDSKIDIPGQCSFLFLVSPHFKTLQLWTLPGKDFICFEPFVGPDNALNIPEQRIVIKPHTSDTLWMKIAVQ